MEDHARNRPSQLSNVFLPRIDAVAVDHHHAIVLRPLFVSSSVVESFMSSMQLEHVVLLL